MIRTAAICIVLLAITLAVYWRVNGFDFVDLDDHATVITNPLVTGGLTPGNLWLALRTAPLDYWRPLSWVSFMIDEELYGPEPGGYHRTNLLLHGLNVVLLFLLLRRMTGAEWRSAFVAGLFGLHPLHVESVAWVTERKDVLSALFGILALWAYVSYARRGGWWRYGWIAGMLSLGLMAKPMLVTLPFVFLLLDYWPLNRGFWILDSGFWIQRGRGLPAPNPKSKIQNPKLTWLFLEKLPLLLIAAVASFLVMHRGAASVVDVPLPLRLINAVMAYVQYLGKMVWPQNLAVHYPYPGMWGCPVWNGWQIAGGIALLLVITGAAIVRSRKRPYLIVGWLWFLGMLAPVIGLVNQVGHQGMADRFVYFPLIGMYIAISWGAADLLGRGRMGRLALGGVATAIVLACAALTWRQVAHWKDSNALFQHTLAVTHDNWKAHEYYGDYLYHHEQRFDECIQNFQEMVRLRTDYAPSHFKLGCALAGANRNYEAKFAFETALALDPDDADTHFKLGVVLAVRGETEAAARHIERAMALKPDFAAEYGRTLAKLRAQPGTPPAPP